MKCENSILKYGISSLCAGSWILDTQTLDNNDEASSSWWCAFPLADSWAHGKIPYRIVQVASECSELALLPLLLCWWFEFLGLSPTSPPRFEHYSIGDSMWTSDQIYLLVMLNLIQVLNWISRSILHIIKVVCCFGYQNICAMWSCPKRRCWQWWMFLMARWVVSLARRALPSLLLSKHAGNGLMILSDVSHEFYLAYFCEHWLLLIYTKISNLGLIPKR